MSEPPIYNVLFLCTGNSARSIIAEVLLNRVGRDRFRAFSAGSHPKGELNPSTIAVLLEHRENVEGLRSKDWKEFAQPPAPSLDFVFTVCSRAAAEECPVWPGQPMTAHWGIDDPASVEGDVERRRAFTKAYGEILTRIRLFSSLRFEQLDRLALQREIQKIPERAKRTD